MMILPILDVVSDFLVIFAVTFYNTILFALVVFVFLLPAYYFFYFLFDSKKSPRMTVLPIYGSTVFWLSCTPKAHPLSHLSKQATELKSKNDIVESSSGYCVCPHVNGNPWCKNILSLPVVGWMLFVPVWFVFISLQGMYLILAGFLILFNIPFQCLWFFVGVMLFQTSLWSINRVWGLWLYFWSGEISTNKIMLDTNDIDYSISDARLKVSIVYKLLLETAIMLILQPINLILMGGYGYSTLIG